jgi:hypothetical protein
VLLGESSPRPALSAADLESRLAGQQEGLPRWAGQATDAEGDDDESSTDSDLVSVSHVVSSRFHVVLGLTTGISRTTVPPSKGTMAVESLAAPLHFGLVSHLGRRRVPEDGDVEKTASSSIDTLTLLEC